MAQTSVALCRWGTVSSSSGSCGGPLAWGRLAVESSKEITVRSIRLSDLCQTQILLLPVLGRCDTTFDLSLCLGDLVSASSIPAQVFCKRNASTAGPRGMNLTFRYDNVVCRGFSYRTHYVSCVTAIIPLILVIYFQVILFTCFIIHQMKFSWLPRPGRLSFLFSWLFSDPHSGRRPNSTPDLTMLSEWLQVVIPGQRQRLKSSHRAGGRSWTGAGGGVGKRPDSNGDGDRCTEGGEGKQHGAGAPCLQPALMCAVREEGGCTRQRKMASSAYYSPKWKINDHPTAWAPCCTSQPRVFIGFNNPDCVFHTCWCLSLCSGFVKSGYLHEAGGTQANPCHFGKQGMWAQHRQ